MSLSRLTGPCARLGRVQAQVRLPHQHPSIATHQHHEPQRFLHGTRSFGLKSRVAQTASLEPLERATLLGVHGEHGFRGPGMADVQGALVPQSGMRIQRSRPPFLVLSLIVVTLVPLSTSTLHRFRSPFNAVQRRVSPQLQDDPTDSRAKAQVEA